MTNTVEQQQKISEELVDFMITMIGAPPSTPLKSESEQRKELVETTKQGVELFSHRLSSGMQAMVQNGIFTMIKPASEGTTEVIQKEISFSEPMQDVFQITDEEMMRAYEYATDCFKNKNYKDSGNVFMTLIVLNPTIRSFWLGFALAEEMDQNYQSAAAAYLMIVDLDPMDLTSAISGAQCLLHAKEDEKAKNLLIHIIERATDNQQAKKLAQELLLQVAARQSF